MTTTTTQPSAPALRTQHVADAVIAAYISEISGTAHGADRQANGRIARPRAATSRLASAMEDGATAAEASASRAKRSRRPRWGSPAMPCAA